MVTSPKEPLVAILPADVVEVSGAERIDLLQRLSTNDLLSLNKTNAVTSTVFTTEKGRVVDWSWLLALDETLMLRTSPGRGARVAEWIDKFTIMEDVSTKIVTESWRHVVVHGPGSMAACGVEVAEHGATPADGGYWWRGLAAYGERLEGLLPSEQADAVVARAQAAGAEIATAHDLEMVRLRAGVPSPGHEFHDEVNPLELRLKSAVSWTKGCYVGQEVIARMDSYDKVARYLMGFEGDAPSELNVNAAAGSKLSRDESALGRVTSIAADPSRGLVGLAVVKRDAACSGPAVLDLNGTPVAVTLTDRPFWGP